MRIIIQSLAGSLVVHIVYFLCMIAVGLVQTYMFKPHFAPSTLILQNEIVFGYVIRFPYIGLSFVTVASIIGLLLIIRDKKKRLSV